MKYKQYEEMNLKEGEAFINECKGNLFEYLVGLSISRVIGKEGSYLEALPYEMRKRFQEYESFLRANDIKLLKKLLEFSNVTSEKILGSIREEILEVKIIGKLADANLKIEYKEADLLLKTEKGIIPLSLKLSKKGAYVNTKSAGVKSFISKYFADFNDANKLQEELNFHIDKCFMEMGQALYETLGIAFPGTFDDTWKEEGLSELPGELDQGMKDIVTLNYQKTNQKIYSIIEEFSSDRDQFSHALIPLLGLGHSQMMQVICFNHKDSSGEYILDRIIINDAETLGQLSNFKILPLNKTISSFEIKLDHCKLQIRVKPMNKFTTPSYKINCSVRYGEDNA